MKSPLLAGEAIVLRAIDEKDKNTLVNLERDVEFLRLVGENVSSETMLSENEFKDLRTRDLHWAIDLNGECIGVAFLHTLNKNDKRAEYAIGIFSPEHWGHGYGEQATRLILDYAFSELSLHRVGLRVLSYNDRAIRCYEKCGFSVEGEQRESAWVNGEWHSDLLMGVLAGEHKI
jgi:RimJ/RimL family protein N-acetyltransferase